MLIRFFLENFLSYNDQVEFSMVPGRGRLFPDHIVRRKKSTGINVLKSAVIYGPNAAGKSNLMKAISFAKKMVILGTKANEPIPLKKFQLNLKNSRKPSKFQFDFKHRDKYYSYGFILDTNQIYEEWLYEINKFREKLLFERKTNSGDVSKVNFGKINSSRSLDKQFLKFVGKGTRSNQLFLTQSIEQNVQDFIYPYEWFDNVLRVIFPDSKYDGIEFFFAQRRNVKDVLLKFLQYFDTGISDIECETYSLQKDLPDIPEDVIVRLRKGLKKKDSKAILTSPKNEKFLVYKDHDEAIKAIRLTSKHRIKDSDKKAVFGINEESDGTQRIIDFLPALISLLSTDSVFFIDEIDRSLHPLLVIKFLEVFLKVSSKTNGQLIVTTHDSNLLDLKFLRKDEIWFIEKNKEEESKMYSLEEFKPRYDKDIKKGYLLGRFGAIPSFEDLNKLGLHKK